MSSDKFHCTNGHCLTDCALSSIDYDKDLPPRFCPHSGIVVCWKKHETTEKKPSLFDRITASPEVLAPLFVREVWTAEGPHIVGKWVSAIVPDIYYQTEAEAIAATVARLKGGE